MGLFVFNGITPCTRGRPQGLDVGPPWDGTRLHKLQFRKNKNKKAPYWKKWANKKKGSRKQKKREGFLRAHIKKPSWKKKVHFPKKENERATPSIQMSKLWSIKISFPETYYEIISFSRWDLSFLNPLPHPIKIVWIDWCVLCGIYPRWFSELLSMIITYVLITHS